MGLICAITDKDLNEKSVEISNPKLNNNIPIIIKIIFIFSFILIY